MANRSNSAVRLTVPPEPTVSVPSANLPMIATPLYRNGGTIDIHDAGTAVAIAQHQVARAGYRAAVVHRQGAGTTTANIQPAAVGQQALAGDMNRPSLPANAPMVLKAAAVRVPSLTVTLPLPPSPTIAPPLAVQTPPDGNSHVARTAGCNAERRQAACAERGAIAHSQRTRRTNRGTKAQKPGTLPLTAVPDCSVHSVPFR